MKDSFVFINHILESISLIETFMKGVSKKDFMLNKEKQSAVVRQIEIIGEAVKNLPASFRKNYSDVPWKKIAGMRDKLIHNYFGLDLDAIYKVVKDDLPVLKKQIKKILEKETD